MSAYEPHRKTFIGLTSGGWLHMLLFVLWMPVALLGVHWLAGTQRPTVMETFMYVLGLALGFWEGRSGR